VGGEPGGTRIGRAEHIAAGGAEVELQRVAFARRCRTPAGRS
jgi:hypothetical protein